MRPRWYARWRLLAIGIDLVFIAVPLMAFTAARFGMDAVRSGFVPAPGRDFGRAPLAFAVPVWLVVLAALRLYDPQRSHNGLEESRRLITAGPAAAVSLVMLGFLVKENPARSWLFGAIVVATLGAAVGRQTLRSIVSRFRENGRWLTKTVFVGRAQAKAVVEAVLADRASGIEPVAVCGFDWPGTPSFTTTEVDLAVRSTSAAEVIVVAEDLERHEIGRAVEVADHQPVHVVVLPGLDHLLLGSLQLVTVAHEPGVALQAPSLRGYQATIKRAVDLIGGVVLLVLTAPLMAVCALAVTIGSGGGPALFRQERVGVGGKTFDLLKFRTMIEGVTATELDQELSDELRFVPKAEDDGRITRVGRFLRQTSIDELPQLWNVIRGDMSLVGPRPLRSWEAERLGLRRRLLVRPGLTGLWQVSGRSSLSPNERIRLDLVYIQNWNILFDLAIMLRTVPAVIGRRGAF